MGDLKLSEQLIEIVEHEARGAIDTLRHVTPLGHIEAVLTAAAERITHLESTNTELTKRVAELESILDSRVAAGKRIAERVRALAEALRELSPGPHPEPMDAEDYVPLIARQIADLQDQLAWTPVSKGLPTEPGVYVFANPGGESVVVGLDDAGSWVLRGERLELWEIRYWQCFRRIELPKGGEPC